MQFPDYEKSQSTNFIRLCILVYIQFLRSVSRDYSATGSKQTTNQPQAATTANDSLEGLSHSLELKLNHTITEIEKRSGQV
jgi:hypothetical protein